MRKFILLVYVIAALPALAREPKFFPKTVNPWKTADAPLFNADYGFGKPEFEDLMQAFERKRKPTTRRLAIEVRPDDARVVRYSGRMDRSALRSGETFAVEAHFRPAGQGSWAGSRPMVLRHFDVRYTLVVPYKGKGRRIVKVVDARVTPQGWINSFRSATEETRIGRKPFASSPELENHIAFVPGQLAAEIRPVLRTILRIVAEQARLAYRKVGTKI